MKATYIKPAIRSRIIETDAPLMAASGENGITPTGLDDVTYKGAASTYGITSAGAKGNGRWGSWDDDEQ